MEKKLTRKEILTELNKLYLLMEMSPEETIAYVNEISNLSHEFDLCGAYSYMRGRLSASVKILLCDALGVNFWDKGLENFSDLIDGNYHGIE